MSKTTTNKKNTPADHYQINLKNDLERFVNAGTPFTTLEAYIQTKRSNVSYKKKSLIVSSPKDAGGFQVENNRIFDSNIDWDWFFASIKNNPITKNTLKKLECEFINEKTTAVFVNCKRRKANKNLKQMLLLSGDEDRNYLVDQIVQFELPVTSFSCMGRFYKSEEEFLTRVESGKVTILDYRPSEFRDLSAEDKKILKRKKDNIPTPPELGFTLLDQVKWHRSGNVLFYDKEKGMCVLTGQDEGTFFGVELPKKCNTIEQALKALIPEKAKGKSYFRQGEWFLVPVSNDEVPKLKDCITFQQDQEAIVCLPVETDDSNCHNLHTFDLRIDKNGVFFAKELTLDHFEHKTIYTDKNQWYALYKNTALRSFSEEGVD